MKWGAYTDEALAINNFVSSIHITGKVNLIDKNAYQFFRIWVTSFLMVSNDE